MRQLILTAVTISMMLPFSANANEPGIKGRNVAETVFATLDRSDRGRIHMGDIEDFRDSVFAGMDSDDNSLVTFPEFAFWDPGFRPVAKALNRQDALTTALKIVFAFWDRNGDGDLTQAEMRTAMSADFRRADIDDDGFLSRDEFIGNFMIIVAMRAAIRPDL